VNKSELVLAKWRVSQWQGLWLIGPTRLDVLMEFFQDHIVSHAKIYDKFGNHVSHVEAHGKYLYMCSQETVFKVPENRFVWWDRR